MSKKRKSNELDGKPDLAVSCPVQSSDRKRHELEEENQSDLPTQASLRYVFSALGVYNLILCRKPYPKIVTLVGANKERFSIHKDVLAKYSKFYREELADLNERELYLPYVDFEVFSCLYNFIDTGKVYEDTEFSILFRSWKLAKELEIASFCSLLLVCMVAHNKQMGLPSVQDMTNAWRSTEIGCILRVMLIDWIYSMYFCFLFYIHVNEFRKKRSRHYKTSF